jgi:hypothetical protein
VFFGIVIKTVLDVTNTINFDHGFCLWIRSLRWNDVIVTALLLIS